MLDGLQIRNRITHPMQAAEMTITDKDLDTVKKAKFWADSLIRNLFEERTRAMNRIRDGIRSRELKYPYIIHAGSFGSERGVEAVIQDYIWYKGEKIKRIDPDEMVPTDVTFPVRLMLGL
jgi:hypothetical protein